MEQLVYLVSDPAILWSYILVILCIFAIFMGYYSRNLFIARELIYGVCNPRPEYVEEVIASELAHALLQEREAEMYAIRLSTLSKDEVDHKKELLRSAKYARERMERLKMYARHFTIQISDERIDVLAVKKLRERANNL